jgi:superfamily II DNA/RNA helicase
MHVMVVSNAPTRCMDFEGIANVMNYDIPIYVATLALGLQGCEPRRKPRESHLMLPGA